MTTSREDVPPSPPLTALLIDDDIELATLLTEYFAGHGVELTHAADGPRGLARLAEHPPDVVLLDVMLPGIDGFEVCRRIRARYTVPVLMLTARGEDDDRIVGLELGADDYVPKPFNPRELLARVRAVLRRAKPESVSEHLSVGDLLLDVGEFKASLAGAPLPLTAFEFRVLVALARKVGKTVPREELAAAVKGEGYDPQVDRSLDVHVSRLRQKLGDDPRDPKRIRTVRGVGYVLVRPS